MPIKGASHITKHLRGIHNAWRFWFESALVLTAQWFRSCSPLNAALVEKELQWTKIYTKNNTTLN
ncbi:hypothetical protein CGI80_11645 [Vibrio parahaemolyticus]|nr:hypothetical protein CGI80_11645 [Vibrio parahaemolyticus]